MCTSMKPNVVLLFPSVCTRVMYFNLSLKLLAGSRVNDADRHRQTALHMAAANNRAAISSVLLENGIDPDAVDERGNNGREFSK